MEGCVRTELRHPLQQVGGLQQSEGGVRELHDQVPEPIRGAAGEHLLERLAEGGVRRHDQTVVGHQVLHAASLVQHPPKPDGACHGVQEREALDE